MSFLRRPVSFFHDASDECRSHNCAGAHDWTWVASVLSHETGREVDTCGQDWEVNHLYLFVCVCLSASISIFVCGKQWMCVFRPARKGLTKLTSPNKVRRETEKSFLIGFTQLGCLDSPRLFAHQPISDWFQIPPCVIDSHPDQSSGLGAHRHAQWAASNQDLPRETLLQERRHAGQDAPLQPALGTTRWGSWKTNTHKHTESQNKWTSDKTPRLIFIFAEAGTHPHLSPLIIPAQRQVGTVLHMQLH